MKSHLKVIDRILDKIAESQSICIVGHVRPDGDCVGSELGLTLALRKHGKDVVCWNEDVVPQKYAFLDPHHILEKPAGSPRFDLVIATDCASFERLGVAGPAIASRKCLINIDHHLSNTRYGDLNWISAREASTGELIFRLLQTAQWPITPAIADCLFTAVSTDTGSFQYPTTKPMTYHAAGELVQIGRGRGHHLARSLSILFVVPRPAAQTSLQPLSSDARQSNRVSLVEEKGLCANRRGKQRHRGPY